MCSLISQYQCHPWAGNDFHKELGNNRLIHSQNITHSQSNRWVSQATQPSHLTVGFHRLSRQQAKTLLGFTGYTAKPANSWVSQTQANIHTKDQPIQQMGFTGYTAKPSFTVGFHRLSSQGLHAWPKEHIKHSQANLQLGFTDCPSKPIYYGVSQATCLQAKS